jgi:hypothetical protein
MKYFIPYPHPTPHTFPQLFHNPISILNTLEAKMKTKESKERTHTNNETKRIKTKNTYQQRNHQGKKKNFGGEVRIVPGYELQLRYDLGGTSIKVGEGGRAGGASYIVSATHDSRVLGGVQYSYT